MTDETASGPAAELMRCIGRIRRRGWCEGTSGNYSVTVSRDPLRLLITPSGADKGDLRAEDLLEVGEDGRPLVPGSPEPSAEAALHVTLARGAGAVAVLHTHSPWGTLLGEHFLPRGGLELRGYEMLKGIEGVTSHERAVFLPVLANTQDMPALAVTVEGLLDRDRGTRAFLIAGHGLYTWGRSLAAAYRHVEIFEFLLRVVGRRVRLEPFEG